jgi:hypothetical protein
VARNRRLVAAPGAADRSTTGVAQFVTERTSRPAAAASRTAIAAATPPLSHAEAGRIGTRHVGVERGMPASCGARTTAAISRRSATSDRRRRAGRSCLRGNAAASHAPDEDTCPTKSRARPEHVPDQNTRVDAWHGRLMNPTSRYPRPLAVPAGKQHRPGSCRVGCDDAVRSAAWPPDERIRAYAAYWSELFRARAREQIAS